MAELATKKQQEPIVKNLRYMRDRDREKVKGIFRYHEVPGAAFAFCHRIYKEDPVEKYNLLDGEMYELPLGVARHLNEACWYPIHDYIKDETGAPVARVTKKVHRTSFASLEFNHIEGLSTIAKPESGIVTVETVNRK